MKRPIVFLDSSVIIAGLGSFKASSYAILALGHNRQLTITVSQVVRQESQDRAYKVGRLPTEVDDLLVWTNAKIFNAPTDELVEKFSNLTPDPNDRHLFASCSQIKNAVLISLDKKHILSQRGKISSPTIFSPGEFLKKYFI